MGVGTHLGHRCVPSQDLKEATEGEGGEVVGEGRAEKARESDGGSADEHVHKHGKGVPKTEGKKGEGKSRKGKRKGKRKQKKSE